MSSPISAFTAVPNPQMLAFMATQSFLMMQMAGAGWQYGKRKISAMKNEEFNALTVNALLQQEVADVRQAIPTIIKSIQDMTPMVGHIVAQYGEFIKEIINATPQLVKNIYQPTEKPSIETFNPLSVINPLLPAFATDASTQTTSPAINDLNRVIRNINSTTNLDILRNINLAQYGFNQSDFVKASRALIKRMEKLNPQSGFHVKKLLPSSTNILTKTRVSKQTLRLERTQLINAVRSEERVLRLTKSKHKGTPRDTVKRNAYQKQILVLKNIKQELSNFLARWKGVKY